MKEYLMNRVTKAALGSALLAACAIGMTACGSSSSDSYNEVVAKLEAQHVTEISVDAAALYKQQIPNDTLLFRGLYGGNEVTISYIGEQSEYLPGRAIITRVGSSDVSEIIDLSD